MFDVKEDYVDCINRLQRIRVLCFLASFYLLKRSFIQTKTKEYQLHRDIEFVTTSVTRLQQMRGRNSRET